MPSGHVAHASLRGDARIHYYLVMDFTDNNNQTISDRSVIWVHGTYHPSLTWEKFVRSVTSTNLEIFDCIRNRLIPLIIYSNLLLRGTVN